MAAQQQSVKITRTTGTGSYAAGFIINESGSTSMLSYNFGSQDSISKFLLGGTLVSSNSASLSANMQLLLFNNSWSLQQDSSSFNPTAAQLDAYMGSITFDTWIGLASNKVSDGKCTKPTVVSNGNIYGVLIAGATYVPTSQETFIIKLDLDNQ